MTIEDDARLIFHQTLKAIDPKTVIRKKLKLKENTLNVEKQAVDLSRFKEVVLIGMGKASLTAGESVEELMGERIKRGLLVCDRRRRVKVKSEVIIAGHPVPDENSFEAGRQILSLVQSCDENSLIIFLISGGGSSLVELPATPEITLEDVKELNRILTGCGASIREINQVRKCISKIKGGRLGFLSRHVPTIALFISDVNPGDLESLASNPLLADDATAKAAKETIDRYGLKSRLPRSVQEAVEEEGDRDYTIHQDGNRLADLLLMDNSDALEAASRFAENRGYRAKIVRDLIEGDYEDVVEKSIHLLANLQNEFPRSPVCLISGGEVSCPVKGSGYGGRNQEFVLYCASRLGEMTVRSETAVLSCGTDGIDGNSNAAGSVAIPELIRAAGDQGIISKEFIQRSDSHSFFKRMGGLIFTGPTGNNVRDVRLLLSRPC
jgi:glycerate-2-kinase